MLIKFAWRQSGGEFDTSHRCVAAETQPNLDSFVSRTAGNCASKQTTKLEIIESIFYFTHFVYRRITSYHTTINARL